MTMANRGRNCQKAALLFTFGLALAGGGFSAAASSHVIRSSMEAPAAAALGGDILSAGLTGSVSQRRQGYQWFSINPKAVAGIIDPAIQSLLASAESGPATSSPTEAVPDGSTVSPPVK